MLIRAFAVLMLAAAAPAVTELPFDALAAARPSHAGAVAAPAVFRAFAVAQWRRSVTVDAFEQF